MMSRRKLGLLDCMKKGLAQDVRFLLELETDLKEKDEDGRTALILCPFIDDQKWATGLARHLLEKGASLQNKDNLGRNALHYACIYERVDLTRVLLGAADFNLNQTDKRGNTALFYAVLSNSCVLTELIAKSLCRYKMTLDKANKEGLTPLQQSRLLKYTECESIIRKFQKSGNTEKNDNYENIKEGHDRSGITFMFNKIDKNYVSRLKSRPKSAHASCMPSRSRNEAQGSIRKRSSISNMSSSSSGSAHHHRLSRPLSGRGWTSHSVAYREAGLQPHPMTGLREAKKIIRISTSPKPVNISAVDIFIHNGGSTRNPNVEGLGDGQSYNVINTGKSPRRRTWRNEIKDLFVTYEQQLTSSYRRPVKQLILEAPEEDTPPISPLIENDILEEMPEVRFSLSRRMSRRMSVASSKAMPQMVTDFPKRRASIAVPRIGRRSSNTEPTGLKLKQTPSNVQSPIAEPAASAKLPKRPSRELHIRNTGTEPASVLPSSSVSTSVASFGGEPIAGFIQAERIGSRGSHTSAQVSHSEILPIHSHENLCSTHSANVLQVHDEEPRHAPLSRPTSRGSLHDTPSVIVTVPSDEDQLEIPAIPATSMGSVHTLSVLTENDEC